MVAQIDFNKLYNRWLPLQLAGKIAYHDYVYCQCICGTVRKVNLRSVLNSKSKSCGCYDREVAAERGRKLLTIHGLSRHPVHVAWRNAIRRCYNPADKNYHNYGSRGIIMCDEWRSDFMAFYNWAIENGWDNGLVLDRFPNGDGNYEPSNCRWTTDLISRRLTRRIKLTLEKAIEIRTRLKGGEAAKLLATEFGVSYNLIQDVRKNRIWNNAD